jgi:hypothetical protein
VTRTVKVWRVEYIAVTNGGLYRQSMRLLADSLVEAATDVSVVHGINQRDVSEVKQDGEVQIG